MFFNEQILAGEQNDESLSQPSLSSSEDTEEKSADQEALEEQKADLQANLRSDRQKTC